MSDTRTAAIADFAGLVAHALAVEEEAAERYAELAAQMSTHNNPQAAELFSEMARVESLHADKIRQRAAHLTLPDIAPWDYCWRDPEGPETTLLDEVHYLMTPRQALTLALHNERRALEFFAGILAHARDDDMRTLASELAADEREHVRLVEEWLAKLPETPPDWDQDTDPPALQD